MIVFIHRFNPVAMILDDRYSLTSIFLSSIFPMSFKYTILGLCAASLAIAAPVSKPVVRRGNLPEPIAVSTAKSYLSQLTVASEVNSPAYVRDYFYTWSPISGSCDTREYVLKRDGSNVVTTSSCEVTSGTWYSDYDGATWTAAGDVDIDHIVPLVGNGLQ